MMSIMKYSFYVRLFLEANQTFLLASLSEINQFVIGPTASTISLCIAGAFALFSFSFCLNSYYASFKYLKDFDPNNKFLIMEYYAGIKESKWARFYTPILLTRRLLFVVVILLLQFSGKDTTFIFLIVIQAAYIGQLVILRPFRQIENNIVEVSNEAFYVGYLIMIFVLDGESMWSDQMSKIFVFCITANNFAIALVMLSKLKFNNLV
jgi:hypothetical protein